MNEKVTDIPLPSSDVPRVLNYRCLLCNEINIAPEDVSGHKDRHGAHKRYGLLLPQSLWTPSMQSTQVPTYSSPLIAKALGVSHVYIRDEGANYSGSMKDYIVKRCIAQGQLLGKKRFAVVSSGNHAVSLAMHAARANSEAIVFTPASSSKIALLATFSNVVVVGMHGAHFEDVYNLVTQINLGDSIYNANACNEDLLPGLLPVAQDISSLDPQPTHVLAGVGNGTYLAGIGFGVLRNISTHTIKIVPCGMKGAFPTEDAFLNGTPIQEYATFAVDESLIDAAEGSIALESYSMPQLMYAVNATNGFPLGGLTNDDLEAAYRLLASDADLLACGAIPEPTGIMSLAAALKWKDRFDSMSVLHCSFTGHGVKDLETILRLVPDEIGKALAERASAARPDLLPDTTSESRGVVLYIDKDTTGERLQQLLGERARI